MSFAAPTGRLAVGGVLGFALLLVLLDRIAKLASVTSWSAEPVTLLPGVAFTFLLNPGIIFSLPVGGTLAMVVTVFVAGAFLVWLFHSLTRHAYATALPLGVILLGASSNLADRFLYGGVVDYIALGPLPVFNLGDVLVMLGVGLLLWQSTGRGQNPKEQIPSTK